MRVNDLLGRTGRMPRARHGADSGVRDSAAAVASDFDPEDPDDVADHTVGDDVARVLEAAARGDLEQRVAVPDRTGTRELLVARRLNHLLDVMDAFVRESGATLEATAEGRFHRQFLTRGMPGTFHDGAKRIDEAHSAMYATSAQLRREKEREVAMAGRAQDISGQVAAASTELSASADALAQSMEVAVTEADAASGMVGDLETASVQINEAVKLIARIAAQTRMLSLNATIEAARAGEAGKGFAVVAEEVKALSDETATSLDAITAEVENARAAAASVSQAIQMVTTVVRDIDLQAKGIAEAAGGEGGLSYLAETLSNDLGGNAGR